MGHRVRGFLSTVIAVFLPITIPSLLDFSDPAIAHFNHTVASATVLTELPGNESSSVAFIPFSLEPLQNLINQINRQITESNQGNLTLKNHLSINFDVDLYCSLETTQSFASKNFS